MIEDVPEMVGLIRSPSTQKAIIEHRMKVEDLEKVNQYRTCCGAMSDKRLLIFISSLSISLLILCFSCYKLAHNNDCQNQNTYVGLISLIIGIWIKSPI